MLTLLLFLVRLLAVFNTPFLPLNGPRYVISVDVVEETATAGIKEVEVGHPFASLEGATFCVMYKTKVHMAGVFKNILKAFVDRG